jgi:CBS domain containing-hemolysin-like protein
MTPIDKVTMISDGDQLDEGLVRRLLQTGHSRFPVYR